MERGKSLPIHHENENNESLQKEKIKYAQNNSFVNTNKGNSQNIEPNFIVIIIFSLILLFYHAYVGLGGLVVYSLYFGYNKYGNNGLAIALILSIVGTLIIKNRMDQIDRQNLERQNEEKMNRLLNIGFNVFRRVTGI